MSERTALVIGATGLIGRQLVSLLLEDPSWTRVRVIARRDPGFSSPKLDLHLLDFDGLHDHPNLFAVDDVFCCLGTTMKQAGSRDAFRRVDLDYPVDAARLGHAGGARQYLLVSASSADARSLFFYNRVKGEAEERVRSVGFPSLVIARPSLLLGPREVPRGLERLGELALGLLSPLMIGPLADQRPIPGAAVARALQKAAHTPESGVRVLSGRALVALAG